MSRFTGNPNPPAAPAANEIDESEKTLTLMGGVAKAENLGDGTVLDIDPGAGSAGNSVISQGTLLIIVAFVVAAGSLLIMRQQRADPESTAGKEVEAKIEEALAKLSKPGAMAENDMLRKENINTLFRDTNAVVAMFTSDVTQQQVPVEFLKKNPFQIAITRPVEMAANPVANNEAQRQKKLEALRLELKDLELQSIMQGRVPVAVINGQLMQSGQKLGNFVIKEINGLNVVLEGDGERFTLTMQQKAEEREPARRRR